MIEELHVHSNAHMQQKSIIETIQAVAPIMADVIKQGIEEGIYHVEYDRETVEFILVANQFIFDRGIIKWEPEELMMWAAAFVRMTERALGASQGSFDFLLESFQKQESRGAAVEKQSVFKRFQSGCNRSDRVHSRVCNFAVCSRPLCAGYYGACGCFCISACIVGHTRYHLHPHRRRFR